MYRTIFPTKSLANTIATFNQIVYNSADFFNAGGYAEIQAPFSLSMRIVNPSNTPLYIGVDVVTNVGVVVVSDRVNLGFVAPGETKTISSASVPPLASINAPANINQININIWSLVTIGATPVLVNLVLDAPIDVSSQSNIIGRDRLVDISGFYNTVESNATINAGVVNGAIFASLFLPGLFVRMRIIDVWIILPPTVWPNDLRAYIYTQDAGGTNTTLITVSSNMIDGIFVTKAIDAPLAPGAGVLSRCTNINAGRNYTVTAGFSYEVMV